MIRKEKPRKKTKFKLHEEDLNQQSKPKNKRPKNKYRHFQKWLDETDAA